MKKKLSLFCFFLTAIILAASSAVSAEEITFEATVDRSIIALGQSTQLNLAFQGTRNVPRPELPEIAGFQIRYLGPSTRMSIVNGRMSSSITHMYSLVPLKTGKFTIGPFSFKHKGDTYKSNELAVEVVDRQTGLQSSPRKHTTDMNLKDRVFLTMQAGKSEAYINEVVPLTIKLYVNSFAVRDIQYPEFAHEGFSADKFGKPKQYQHNRGDIIYDVIEFKTHIFGTRPGQFTLGPAELKANLLMKRQRRRRLSPFDDFFGRDPFDDFFGNYERHPIELSSKELSVTVLPFPDHGRPKDFAGSVGNFNLDLLASPAEVKVGDPVTLKMIVFGEGNFNTVTSPHIKSDKNFKVYEPQVKQEENKKIFEQVLIPTSAAIVKIPEVSFSFFNTEKGQYQTIVKRDIPLKVLRPEMKEEITILDAPHVAERPLVKEKFGRDIIYIKESPGKLKKKDNYLYRNMLFLFLHTVPLLLLFSVWMLQKRKEKLSTDIGYARRLSAPKKAKKGIHEAERYLNKNKTQEFYDSVFKTLREYIGNRFHLPSGGITADVVDYALKNKSIKEELMNRLRNIFRECDMARYAPSELGTANMENTLKDLREVIDYLERHK